METIVRRLAVAATFGMFLVLVMGATVTNTGSGEGCGRSWPLCHGEFIPEYAVDTAIEFSHRFVTSIEGVLILAVAIGALRLRKTREMRLYVAVMVFSLILQAGMGAWAVKYPQEAAVLATHFGISMICLASTYMVTRLLYETGSGERNDPEVSNAYRLVAALSVLAVIVTSYLGAYMRHSGAELACSTWPDCDGKVYPGFSGLVGVAFGHRVAAVVTTLLVFLLLAMIWSRRESTPALFITNLAAVILVLVQSAIGAIVVLSRLELFATLGHAAAVSLLFVALADTCRMVFPRRRSAASRQVDLSPMPAGAD